MKKLNTILKFVFGLFLGVSITLLVCFNILLGWVATGPRSLDVVGPYIEAALEPPDHKYSVSVGETWLIWDGWKHPIDIRLRNVKVMTSERRTYLRFPEISLGLDLLSLTVGQILPTSVTITHPVISLYQNEDRSLSFGLAVESASESPASPAESPSESPAVAAEKPTAAEIAAVPFAVVIAPLLNPDSNSPLRKLHYVSIVNADLTLGSKDKGAFFSATGADIVFKHNRKGLQAMGKAKISYDNYSSDISVRVVQETGSPTMTGSISTSELQPAVLARLFGDNSLLNAMKFPVSGNATVVLDAEGKLQKLGFDADAGKGTLETDKLDGTLPVSALHVEGELAGNMTDLHIGKVSADLGGVQLEGSGDASINGMDSAIKAQLALSNGTAENIHQLWPPGLAPLSREWVTTNILSGKMPHAQIQVNIPAGDLAKKILPKEDIDASIDMENTKIRYLPDHPEVSEVRGRVHIDGLSLEANIESASYMKDTKLMSGKLLIADLNDDNPYIKLDLSAESTAKDAVKFLGLPRLKHAQRLNMKEDAEGTFKGQAALGFRFFAPRNAKGEPIGEADIDYDVTAELKGVSQPGFMNKFDIKGAEGTLKVNNTAVEFKGTGNVNGASVSESTVQYLFHPKDAYDTIIDVNATAPVESLPRFGYPQFAFLKGKLGVKANVKEGKATEVAQATIDLTDATIHWPSLGLEKADKIAATLDLTSEKKEGVATIPSFHIKGKELDAHGAAELTQDMSDVKRVTMDKVINGETKLDQLTYEPIDGGFILHFTGSSFDATPWTSGSSEGGGFSFEHFPALQFKGDVGRVLFAPGREVLAVKGEMSCDKHHCETANINGKTTDNKPFSFRILRNPKGARAMSLHAQSAGAFLYATNLFDGMEGGDLSLTGTYDDGAKDKDDTVFHGRLDINEHTVKKVPVLAKILSLASLTGFFDTLQGKGIHFVRLNAPFKLYKDVITLDSAKTHGDAMGMTAEGTITFPQRTMDIQGTVVPSYSLNNVLGKVPLVGAVLTGGEGQGVFAARYSLKGSGSDPDVSVNPLSILTPGFLRGLFDILDRPKKQEEPEPEEESEPAKN